MTSGNAAGDVPRFGMSRSRSCREWSERRIHRKASGRMRHPVDIVSPQDIRELTRQAARRPAALLIWMVAVLAAAFKKIKNRGNELRDLLQRQGITETAASKRTQFGDCHGLPSPGPGRSYTIRGRASSTPTRFRSRGAAPESSPRRKPWDPRTAFVSAAPEGRQRQCRGICCPSGAYTTMGRSSIPRLTPWATLCWPSGPLEADTANRPCQCRAGALKCNVWAMRVGRGGRANLWEAIYNSL